MARFRLFTIIVLMAAVAASAAAIELTGRVVSEDGAPVAGATVTASGAANVVTVETMADGRFALHLPKSAEGPVTLTVAAPGLQTTTLAVTDAERPVTVVLPPARVFSDIVEVTATRARRGESPVTFTNIPREEIERGFWGQDVPMFLSQVPGFYAYNDNGADIGYSYFTLRGFDMRRTAVNLNGVPLNDAESHGVFFIDLADFLSTTGDIQVQRGVGTTLYGGNAIGGAVDVRTRHPLEERRLRLTSMAGSWDTRRFGVEYDTGRSKDGWAATFRYSRVDTDGYRDQSWVKMWNYFLSVEKLGPSSSLQINLFGGPEETHLAYLGIPRAYLNGEITGDKRRDRRYNPLTYQGEIDHFFQPHYQLLHTLRVDSRLTLQNTLYYFQGDGFFRQLKLGRWMPEYDLQPFELSDGTVIDTTDLIRKRSIQEWDAGWVGQAIWEHGGGRGTLQAGVALRLHQAHHFGEVVWAEHYPPALAPDHRYYDYEVDKRTVQPFLQETWSLGEKLTLAGGLTWTSHRYELGKDRRKSVTFAESFNFLLPRLGVTWRPASGWSVFANVSRGGREPAFRDLYDPQDFYSERVSLDPEELDDYELGSEYRWRTGFAKVNLYWLHFDNEIVWAGNLDDSGVPVTANGAVANHRGIEAEIGLNPRPRWGARLAASYSRNTFSHFTEFDFDGNAADHSGNRIAGVPDLLLTLQLTGGTGPVDGLLTVRRVGRFFLDNTEDLRKHPELTADPGYVHRINPEQTVVDIALRWALCRRVTETLGARSATIDLRVNNLLDELYTTFGYMDWPEPVWTPAATRSAYLGFTVDW